MKKNCSLLGIFIIIFLFFITSYVQETKAQEEEICKPPVISEERNPRPAACNQCAPELNPTFSCATSLKTEEEINLNSRQNPNPIIEWETQFGINAGEAIIPFVGKENDEKLFDLWENSNTSENDYLADYFEGTNEYYRNYGQQTTLTNYQGVLRKLTPFEYQNQLKKALVNRVSQEGDDHISDYTIKFIGRLCWDMPFWFEAFDFVVDEFTQNILDKSLNRIFAFISGLFNTEKTPEIKVNTPDLGHFCLYASPNDSSLLSWLIVKANETIAEVPIIGDFYDRLLEFSQELPGVIHVRLLPGADGTLSYFNEDNFPPEPGTEDYLEKFLKWKYEDYESGSKKLSKAYRLWQALPMVSREDVRGEIEPYLSTDESENISVLEEDKQLILVPHIARLDEASHQINNILIPTGVEIEKPESSDPSLSVQPDSCIKTDYIFGPKDKGDNICGQKIIGLIQNETENPYYDQCGNLQDLLPEEIPPECFKPPEEILATKDIGVKISLPQLNEIWSYTSYPTSGFFNIFRPYNIPVFEDIDAATSLSYSYESGDSKTSGVNIGNGEVLPQEGLLFYPHLGGIQKAKEWVVGEVLWPYIRQ